MRARRRELCALSALIGMLAVCMCGCTVEEQASIASALGSSAGLAISALFEFVVDFGRQALAAFLF